MTIEQARTILEKSDKLAPVVKNGITYNLLLGEFYRELPDAFGFAVYPYTSNAPVDPTYAFGFYVMKDNGEIIRATAPILESELKKIQKASLG